MSEKKEKNEKIEKVDDGLAATVRKQGELIQKMKNVLERMFGIDIDRDGKIGAFAVLFILSACLAFGASQSTNTVWNVADSTGTNDVVQVDKFGNLTVDGAVTASGALSSGAIVSTGSLTATQLVSGSTVVAPYLLNTNANVVLTLQVPAARGQVLITPNSTNVYTIVGVGATNSHLLRIAISGDGTTNGWITVATDNQ